MGKKKILLLAVAYFAIVLLAYNGRSLGFDEASRGMAGAFYSDLFSGILKGQVNPGNFAAFAGNYHDHYKIVWDVAYFPPMQPLLIALSYLAFGISTRSTLLVNAAAAALSLFLVYKITARVYGKTTIMVPLLLGFGPAFFFYARSVYYDVLMTLFLLMAFYLFLKWLDDPTPLAGPAVGLAIGAGFLTKYPAALALPAIVLFLLATKRGVLKTWPILAGFAMLAAPWLIIQLTATGGDYVGNWLFTGFNPAASGAPGLSMGLAERAASTVITLASGLSIPVAAMVLFGIFVSVLGFRVAEPEAKPKLAALWSWTLVYLGVFAALPITHLEMNRYRYLLPVMPLLLVAGIGPLVERFGIRKVRLLGMVSLFLALAFFAPAFEASQSYFVPVQETGDYFLALSNGASTKALRVLVQDPTLALALRERDPQLKRFYVFYYPPTLLETEELLAGNSSSRSLKLFGLKSCGIEYATLIDYGKNGKRHPIASELIEDWKFDRIIKANDGSGEGSVEIYEYMNVTEC